MPASPLGHRLLETTPETHSALKMGASSQNLKDMGAEKLPRSTEIVQDVLLKPGLGHLPLPVVY